MKNQFLLAVLVLAFLSGCSPIKSSSEYLGEAVELHAVEVYSGFPYRAARTRHIDLVHTQLNVSFDWQQQYLFGEAILTVKPYFYTTNQVVLDAKGQEIKSVVLVDSTVETPLVYTYEHDVLSITLDRMYRRSEMVKIKINYIAKPNERNITGGKAVTDDKGLYFINPLGDDAGTPQQLWTQGETQANSVWFPTIDSPNERCTHQISMTVENRFVTLSNGDKVSAVPHDDGTRTDTWVQNKPIAPYLFMMAVSEFAVVSDSLNGMEVSYYVDKEYAPYAREIFNHTPEMITFYSEVLGYDYPFSKYSQVVVHEYVSGAMENVSAVVFGDFVHQTHREMLDGNYEETVAHELFHHWFGDLVTCESWANLPLNESFATYGEYLWFEHKYGKMKADAHLYADLQSYLQSVKNGNAKNTVRYYYNKPDDMFDSHSYAKGGRILHLLRNYVGDEAFFAALKMYLHENEYTAVEIHQLRLAFEKVTGQDLNWFFNQWFMGKGHPVLDITYTYDTANKVQNIVVQQTQDLNEYGLFILPVDIDIYVGNSKETYHVQVDSAQQTFSFKVDSVPNLVNFDAQKILICEKTENHTMQEMQFMYANAPLYVDKREAIEFAYQETEETEMAKALMLDAMMDDYVGIRSLAVQNYDLFDEINDLKLKSLLVFTANNDPSAEVRTEAVYALADYYSWADGMVDVFKGRLNDSSYAVISEALRGVAISDTAAGMEYAKKFENSESLDVLFSVAEIYSAFGDEENNAFFIELYPKAEGYEVMTFIDLYKDYLLRMEGPAVHESAITVLAKEANNNLGWFVRYYAVSALTDLRVVYAHLEMKNTKKGNPKNAEAFRELIQKVDMVLTRLRLEEKDNRVFMSR